MDIKKEREAFEAWAKISIENFVDLEHYGKFYVVQENSRLTIRKKEFLLLAANRGWKAWKERAKAQAVPEWIDYTKQSPRMNGRYQIFISGEQLTADWESPYGFTCPQDGCAFIQEIISHWMPLPNPPQEQKG